MKISDNTILITGGGSGIGRELAQRFQALGNHVIVAGRNMDSLNETISGRQNMSAYQLDIENPQSISVFARQVLAVHPALNFIINNAGVMRPDDLTRSQALDDAEAQINTNLLGPIRLNNALVDHLCKQNDAVIVNVSSGLAFIPLVATPIYSATKAAIHSYSLSLREQLKGKVTVIELAPPAVQTELTPGQSVRNGYMPLNDFIDEVMALFCAESVGGEILVERVKPLRFVERDGSFETVFAHLNPAATV